MPSYAKNKYRRIIAPPTLDGLFSSGLLNRLFPCQVTLKYLLKTTRNAVLVGVFVHPDTEARNSFIIDNAQCEKYWDHSFPSNFFLCDKAYGSMTDLVSDLFDINVPDDILDAVFSVATRDLYSSEALDFFIADVLTPKTKKLAIIKHVRDANWSFIRDWVKKKSGSIDRNALENRSELLLRNAKRLSIDLATINVGLSSPLDRLSGLIALFKLSEKYKLSALVSHNAKGSNLIVISQRVELRNLARNLIRLGFPLIYRSRIIRARIEPPKLRELIPLLPIIARRSTK